MINMYNDPKQLVEEFKRQLLELTDYTFDLQINDAKQKFITKQKFTMYANIQDILDWVESVEAVL